MSLVIDANIAVDWTAKSSHSEHAERILQSRQQLVAPDIIVAEVANAFLSIAFEDPGKKEVILDAMQILPRWFEELVPSARLRIRATELALELEHPVYDCFYLALAEEKDTVLVTRDIRFLNRLAPTRHNKRAVMPADWKP